MASDPAPESSPAASAPLPPPSAPEWRPDRPEVAQTLRRSALGQGLSSSELDELARHLRPRIYRAGEVVQAQDQPGRVLGIVARGRIRLAVERSHYRFQDYLGRGAHFGEMGLLTEGPSFGTTTAVVESEVWELDREAFQELLERIPRFGANLGRSLGQRMRWVTSGRRHRHRLSVVGLVHATQHTRRLLLPLVRELASREEPLVVLTDRSELEPVDGPYLIERIPAAGARTVEAVHARLTQVLEHGNRVLLDLTQGSAEADLRALLLQCEEVWWLLDPDFVTGSLDRLAHVLSHEASLASRTRLVWLLAPGEKFAPPLDRDLSLLEPSFKVVLGTNPRLVSWPERRTLVRLVRHLGGLKIGLALSGGGARGMAHLGVLRALDRAEIAIDLLAGTSSGALTGMSYAAGWDADDALREFLTHLSTPAWLGRVPGGRYGYLVANFRLGRWDRLLRPYVGTARLEQMQVPISTVTVDLITGRMVVRRTGDAVHAIVESINLPLASRPILRDGMALVDGGILNNLPADVLLEQGADLVVGVDVMNRLPQRFAGNHPGQSPETMRRPGLAETVLRINEVQDHGFTALRQQLVDVMITPDTPRFEFTDFSRAAELADAGQAAAEEQIPRIRERIADLERG